MRILIISMTSLFLIVSVAVSNAYDCVQQNMGGTPHLCDYFNPDPRIQSLVINVEGHHLFSTPYIFGMGKEGRLGNDRLIASGDYDSPIKEMYYVLDRIANHPKALEMMGTLSIIVKDPTLGMFYFKRALILYPQYAITHYQYGCFLIDIGQEEEGIKELTRAVEIEPSLGAAHARLSEAYLKKGDVERARKAEEEARKHGFMEAITADTLTKENPEATK